MAESNTPSTTLNLSTTEFDRPKFTVDGGQVYEMRAREEMSVASLKRQKKLQTGIAYYQNAVRDGRETTEEEFDAYIEDMIGFVQLITVDVPRDVIAELPAGMWKKLMEHYQSFGRAVDTVETAATTN